MFCPAEWRVRNSQLTVRGKEPPQLPETPALTVQDPAKLGRVTQNDTENWDSSFSCGVLVSRGCRRGRRQGNSSHLLGEALWRARNPIDVTFNPQNPTKSINVVTSSLQKGNRCKEINKLHKHVQVRRGGTEVRSHHSDV